LAGLQEVLLGNVTVAAGGLPESWSQLTQLQTLILQDVVLSTAAQQHVLPESWAVLPSLSRLQLDRVYGLTGALPDSWLTGFPSLSDLQFVDVSGLSSRLSEYVLLAQQTRPVAGGVYSTGLTELGAGGFEPEWDGNRELHAQQQVKKSICKCLYRSQCCWCSNIAVYRLLHCEQGYAATGS